MSARSRQAKALARALTAQTAVQVTIDSTGRGQWLLQWAHGPTDDQMRGLVRAELATGPYPDMAGQQVQRHRGWAARAWAARAVAADREGTLRPAVELGEAWRRGLGPLPIQDASTPEERALRAHVEDLIDRTPYPDRASDQADEPAIQRLLAASWGSEARMTALLLASDQAAAGGELPPGVIPLRRREVRRPELASPPPCPLCGRQPIRARLAAQRGRPELVGNVDPEAAAAPHRGGLSFLARSPGPAIAPPDCCGSPTGATGRLKAASRALLVSGFFRRRAPTNPRRWLVAM